MRDDRRRHGRWIRNRKVELLVHLLVAGALLFFAFAGMTILLRRGRAAGSLSVPEKTVPALAGASSVSEALSSKAEAESAESLSALIASPGIGHSVLTDTDCDWRLILVNPSHRLPDDFSVETAALPADPDVRFDARAVGNLEKLVDACEQAGHSIIIRGAFRTLAQQQELFDNKTQEYRKQGLPQEEAEEKAATAVAYPGTSEHELGLAVDIVSADNLDLNTKQEDTPTQKWLMEHSWEYGFVLRYPPEKKALTGIIYEPWHYRYVGRTVAEVMKKEDLCFEEFLSKYGNSTPRDGSDFASGGPES